MTWIIAAKKHMKQAAVRKRDPSRAKGKVFNCVFNKKSGQTFKFVTALFFRSAGRD